MKMTPPLSRTDDLGGLFSVDAREFLVATTHVDRRNVEFAGAGAVSGDLCGRGTRLLIPVELRLDLLPSKARRLKIGRGVPGNLRLAGRTALDFIA